MSCRVNGIPKAPNGEESLVYQILQGDYGEQGALRGYINIRTDAFKRFFGFDWEQSSKNNALLDANGEPKLIDKYVYNSRGERMDIITRDVLTTDLDKAISPTHDPEIVKMLKKWLQAAGITTDFLEKLTDHKGNPVSALAKANMLNATLELVKGKKISSQQLAEETAHFLIEMLGDQHPLVQKMMKDIEGYDEYDIVRYLYGETYSGDDSQLKKEAIGQVLAKLLIEPETAPVKAQRWWEKVLAWLKTKFSRVKIAQVQAELSPFVEAVNIVRSGNTEGLKSKKELMEDASKDLSKSYFFHLSDDMKNEQARILKDLEETGVIKVGNEYQDVKTNRTIAHRVTDLVKAYYRKRFAKGDSETPRSKMLALKGTYLHKIAEVVMDRLIHGQSLDTKTILMESYNELHNEEDFKTLPMSFYTMGSHQINQIIKGVKAIYNRIQENQSRINQLTGTEGEAKVLTELIVYDEKVDRGGTVDIAVVYSDGTMGLYDYKSMNMYSVKGKVVGGIPDYKMDAWNIQLQEYKRILAEQYNVKSFAESRVVPIRVRLNREMRDGFYAIEMQHEENLKKVYLEHIPVADELTTDKDLNKTLEKMFQLRDRLKVQLRNNKSDADTELKLSRLEQAIRKIQLNQDVNYIIDEINSISTEFHDREGLNREHPETLTYADLLDYKEYIDVFRKFAVDAENAAKSDSKTLERLDKVSANIDRLLSRINSKIYDLVHNDSGIDLEKPAKELGMAGRLFRQLSEIKHPAFRFVFKLVEKNSEAVRHELNDAITAIDEKDKALEQWAKSRGKGKQEAYDMIYNKKTGNLVGKYSSKFYSGLKKAREDEDYKWFLNNANVQRKADSKTGLEYTGKTKQKFEANKKRYFDYLDTKYKAKHLEEYREQKKLEYEEKFDITKNIRALYNKNNYYTRPAEKKENYSEEYQNFMEAGNEAVKDYYDMYVDFNQKFAQLTGKRIDDKFVANIRQDMIDRIAQNGMWHAGGLKRHILNSLEVRQVDVLQGQRDATTGELLQNVPLLYQDKLKQSLTESEIEKIKREVGEEFQEGTAEYTDKLSRRIRAGEFEKGLKYKNRDLTSSLILFAEQAFSYQHFSETEDAVRSVQEWVKSGEGKTEITDGSNRRLVDKITQKTLTQLGMPTSQLDALNKFIDAYWYGRNLFGKDITFTLGEKKDDAGNVIQEGKTYSGTKAVKLLMKFVSLKALGLKPILAAGNALGIKSNLYMHGAEGLYYTQANIKKAHQMFLKRDPRYLGAVEYFELHSHDKTGKKARKRSAHKIVDVATMDTALILHRLGDNMADNNILLAMMQHYGIDPEGKIRRLSTLPAGTKSILDMCKVEDGKFSIPELTEEQEISFRTRVQNRASRTKGTIPNENRTLHSTTLIGAMIGHFRTWMIPLSKARFDKLNYDEELGETDGGRFSVAMMEFTRDGVLPKMSAFLELLGASTGLYKMNPDPKVAERMYKRFLEDNPEAEGRVTLEEFIEVRKAKLRGMAMELRLFLSLLTLMLAARSAVPDEDEVDPYEKLAWQNAYRVVRRAYLEVSFFFSPESVVQIVRSPVPVFSVLTDTQKLLKNSVDEFRDTVIGENAPTDKTPYGYYTLKMTPFVSAYVDFMDTFDTYSTIYR